MEQLQQDTIINNIDQQNKLLMDESKNVRLLLTEMAQNIENNANIANTRHQDLLIEIAQLKQLVVEQNANQSRDSKKENKMYEGYMSGLISWISSKKPKKKNKSENILLNSYVGPITRELNVRLATKFCKPSRPDIDPYLMRGRHRGVLFLVNIIDFKKKDKRRNGAEMDKDRLLNLFDEMGFKLFYYENINSDQFDSLIKQLSSSDHLKTTDCLVFGFLSHGIIKNGTALVEFSDGSFPSEQIVEHFSNSNCKHLQGKPKIFLFPFCRGNKSDTGVQYSNTRRGRIEYDTSTFSVIEDRIATYSDIVICYATVPGFLTHRHPEEGSWYIQLLCQVFAQHAHDATFDDLMKYVELEVSKKYGESGSKQTCSVEYRGISKVLYFNPGYFGRIEEEDNATTSTTDTAID